MTIENFVIGANRNPFNYEKVEQISRDVVTPWLTLEDITDQINLFGDSSQDNYLSGLELAVRQFIEDYLGMSIFATGYRVYYNADSLMGVPLSLDLPQISQNSNPAGASITINSVKYWDSSNTLITVDSANYFYDNSGNKIIINSLPTDINSLRTSPVYCEYTTAPNALSTYPVIKHAGLMLITHWYNTRSTATDKIFRDIPFGVHALLRPYKPLVL